MQIVSFARAVDLAAQMMRRQFVLALVGALVACAGFVAGTPSVAQAAQPTSTLVRAAAAGPAATPAASGWHAVRAPHVMPTITSRPRTPTGLDSTSQMTSHSASWAPKGLVLHAPKAYLIFWGVEWQTGWTDSSGLTSAQAMAYIEAFFTDIGGSPWTGITTQYCQNVPALTVVCPNGATFVSNPGLQLAGATIDSHDVVPAAPTDADIQNEAIYMVNNVLGFDPNATYMIFTPTGKSTTGFGAQFCAYHGALLSTPPIQVLSYANMPYQPDAGASCATNLVNASNDVFGHGWFDGFSITGGHEYAESVTDPDVNSGWFDNVDLNAGEIGDKCHTLPDLQNVTFGAQFFAVQRLWSNAANAGTGGCAVALPPKVSLVSPNDGPLAGGTAVTITGANFTAATGVSFGATPAATFSITDASHISATSPAEAAASVDVTVTTPGGTSGTSGADLFTYLAAPTVSAVAPNQGPLGGGTSVIITGTGFTAVSAVAFGGTPATTFSVTDATHISAKSPAGSGTVDVTVTTPGGTSATSVSDNFTYVPAPTVTGVAPNIGPSSGGTLVTITGTNFTGATGVKFGGAAATSVSVTDAAHITATSPAGTGTVDVTVTTPGGTSATNVSDQFTYIPAPTVSSVSPNKGPLAGGTSVTITGTNFAGATGVSFGATPAATFNVTDASHISATSPAESAASVHVTVTGPGGTSSTSNADLFTFLAAPTVSSVAPNQGPLGGGTSVTITGTSFTAVSAVNFGGTPAIFSVTDATHITATSPAGSGTVDVTVTTPGGTSATSVSDNFTYVPAPAVTNVAPNIGPSGGGTSVTITGTNFTGATAVKFGGVAATGVSVTDAAHISATSPAGTGTVDVTVTTPGGTSATSASDHFTYVGPPTVTSVSPKNGSTLGGTSVTITGTNFTNVTAVNFGATPAATFSVTDASHISATSPAGSAATVDIRVTALGGTSAATSADKYTFIPPPCATAAVSPASPSQPAGSTIDFTASSTVCPNPLYEFWVGYPNGTWVMKQRFGVSNMFSWSTAGLTPGTYFVHAWANQTGDSQATYEAFGSSTITLTGCTSASVSPSSVAQPAGTTVNWTASALGCPNPVFAFYVEYPNGTWYLKRQFLSTATFNWSTTGLAPGLYTVHVWANQQNASTATYETFGAGTVALSICTGASLTPSNPSAEAGSMVGLTASSTGCLSPQYEYWAQYLDGTWHMIRTWGVAAFNWNTSGLAPGAYPVHVWANNIGDSTASFEGNGADTVTLTGCATASLAPPSVAQQAGTVVSLTASSTGCSLPQYEFWVGYPNGTWVDKQPFSNMTTFNWNTVGVAPGLYNVHVWANQTGASTSTWEANGAASVALSICASASLSPTSPSIAAGTAIDLTASSTNCASPRYEFWVGYPNGTWSMKQGFSANAVYHFTTNGLAPGTYHIHAWANNAGDPTGTYEALGVDDVTLTGCTVATVTPATGTDPAGTTILFTVAPVTCSGTPVYEFWVQYPDGTWHQETGFTITNTWSWVTTGRATGSYAIHVWVNNQGADTSTFETFAGATHTLN